MILKLMRFISLLFTALATGVAFSHGLKLFPKLELSPAIYLTIQRSLYQNFGQVLGVIEVVALLSTLAVLVLVRKRHIVRLWTLIGLGCLLLMILIWTAFISPINAQIDTWTTVDSLPNNWTYFRNRWEYLHATRAFFALLGMSALIIAVLNDTTSPSRKKTTQFEDTEEFQLSQ